MGRARHLFASQTTRGMTSSSREKRDAELYNLLPGEREKIRAYQGNKDPITGAELKPNANLDHCHHTGLARGLLNPMTNKRLVDNVAVLKRTLEYLENPPAVAALGEKVYGLMGRAQRKRKPRYGPDGRAEPHPRAVAVPALRDVAVPDRPERIPRTRRTRTKVRRG